MHCVHTDRDRCWICGKDSDECCRNTPAENQPEKHDRESHYECGHCILTDFGNEITVDDVVKRIHLVRRRGQCYNYHVYFEMRG